MDKVPQYYSFFTNLLIEGHCIMADVPQKEAMLEFIKNIPNECVYEEAGENYGKETKPHVTVMYGLSPVEESRVKELLSKVPKKIVAELGQISKFSHADTPYDVLKIEVKSPHLNKIHEMIRKNFDNNYKWPQYNPHVTLAYVKKGTCNEYVGNKTFEGMTVMFEAFMYSNGIRELNHAVPMKEYNDSKKLASSVKKELDALSSKYKEHLESWISVDDNGISLGNLRALKTAPAGTGTKFMNDLIAIADKYGMIITLTTGLRDRDAPEVFKKTTSSDRLKRFYSRFGFKSNYDKRSYRPDLRGNMHREPNKNNMKEYFVGQSGGYGGGAMAGGGVSPMNWAGTPSSNQTSRRLNDYPASRRYTYMQGNTVIGSSLYDTITKDDLKHPKFSAQEIMTGLRKEMGRMEYPDKDVAKKTVLKNLETDPKFYSDLKMYFNSDKETTIMENIDPKEIEMGTKHEHEHTQDDALARKIAMDHLKDDPNYYSKLNKAGLEQEGAMTNLEKGYVEGHGDMGDVGSVTPVAPNVAVIKISGPIDAGQASLSSSGMGSGAPKALKTSSIEAPTEKNKVGPNKVVVSKTPAIGGASCDPMNHFGAQMNKKW